ncbi:MAG: hypothetical protein NDI69_00655 [Bacteriovoracaceae bacterium]|nr:hypothetical protein [Bacteriovoracaceae bacterium]
MVTCLKSLMLGLVLSTTSVLAMTEGDRKFNTIASMKVQEISRDILGQNQIETLYQKQLATGLPNEGRVDPVEQAGKVITVSRDLVALGEDLYRLVIKGKPSNQTSYAPLSVIPRVNGQPVDILDTERWRMPVKRSFEVSYQNLYGVDVVTFRYSVLYSSHGQYDGKGAYLTAVQIIPESVRTLFGFDFTATMKLGGIQNQGTKANPIAGATLLIEYTVSSVMNAINKVDTFFVTGLGQFKRL